MTTTMRDALVQAMHLPSGFAIADVDTMSQASHDVDPGIMADHAHPNEKDRQKAQLMVASLQQQSA